MGLGHGDGRLLAVPVCGLELGRWEVAAGAMEALTVPPCHPAGGGQLDLLDGAPRTLTRDELGLEQADDALGQGVVVAVAAAPASARRSV